MWRSRWSARRQRCRSLWLPADACSINALLKKSWQGTNTAKAFAKLRMFQMTFRAVTICIASLMFELVAGKTLSL